ncbi:MAG: DUF222 domain-containing protein [Nocardioidaceae bacterium]
MVTVSAESGSGEILAAVESLNRRQMQIQAQLFRYAYDFAILHDSETLRHVRGGGVLPGTERAIALGGEGTPLVAEFAAVELGARMQMGPVAAGYYLADALDVWHRLPKIAARLDAGEIKVAYARLVAKETRHLSAEAAARVDADMAPFADERLPWTRFCDRLAGRIVAADPELAARREAEAAARQSVRSARRSAHGLKGFHVKAPVALVVRFEATIAYVAEALAALGDPETLEQRRIKAWAILANPTQAVELLATFAAHRAGQTDQPLDGGPEPPPPDLDDEPPPDSRDATGEDPVDAPPDDVDEQAAEDPPLDDEAEDQPPPDRETEHEVGDQTPPPVITPLPWRPTDLPEWLARLTAAAAGQPPTRADGVASAPSNRPGKPSGEDSGSGTPTGWAWSWSHLLPDVDLVVHVAKETLDAGDGVVRVPGEEPMTWGYVRDRLGPHARFSISPVLDLAGQEPVDAYEIPTRHRRSVHLISPAECFPYSSSTSTCVDVDHNEPFEFEDDTSGTDSHSGSPSGHRKPARPGQSRLDNYGPLGRFAHRVKTHGRWTVKQPVLGIWLWRDEHGEIYLVDNTGTRKATDGTVAGRPGHQPQRDCAIELYPSDTVLEVDFHCQSA